MTLLKLEAVVRAFTMSRARVIVTPANHLQPAQARPPHLAQLPNTSRILPLQLVAQLVDLQMSATQDQLNSPIQGSVTLATTGHQQLLALNAPPVTTVLLWPPLKQPAPQIMCRLLATLLALSAQQDMPVLARILLK